MGLNHSPKIVTDGLVFAYDMGNTNKSWKGAPTTNLYQDTFGATGTLDGFGGGSLLDTTLSIQNPFNTGIVYARKSNSGVATWSVQANLTAGVTYTYSIWCNPLAWTSISMRRNEPSVYVAESKSVSVTPGVWTRVSFTFTVSAGKTGSQVVGIGVGDVNVGGDNRGIYLYGAMLEQQSFATPYTNTSRSNTQAILDLTGLNTVTASSLTYNSDNTFSFNGSSNAIDLGNGVNLQQSTAITMSAWINPVSASGLGNIMAKNYNAAYRFRIDSVANGLWWYVSGNSIQGGQCPNNVWSHCTVTGDSSGLKAYVNGQLVASNSTPFLPTSPADGNLLIGMVGSGEYFNGKIATASMYSRALTAAEVLQNFNTLRGRFGI